MELDLIIGKALTNDIGFSGRKAVKLKVMKRI